MSPKPKKPLIYPCSWDAIDGNPLDKQPCFWCGNETSYQEDSYRFTRVKNASAFQDKAEEAGFYPRIDVGAPTRILVRSCPDHKHHSDALEHEVKAEKGMGLSLLIEAVKR